MFGNDYLSVVFYNEMSTERPNTEPTTRNGKQQTKRQDENKHHRGSRHVSKKYEYPKELLDDLLKRIEDKDSEIEMLRKRNEDKDSKIEKLEKINEAVKERSAKITKEMAKVTDTKGSFENANDELANTNLTERFSKLYDEDLVRLFKWLIRTYSAIPELQMIHYVTDLMRNGYRECLKFSEWHIRQFLLLGGSQDIPSFVNHPEVYAIRKTYVQAETARTEVKRVVIEKILPASENSTFFEGDKSQETKRLLQDFLCKYLDCCWLMIVSVPPISLNFEVVGKQFCKEHFRKYFFKKPVEDETKQEDTVYEVVWPCVCLQDGPAFYRKGDVVVVTKGMVKEDKLEHTECNCFSTDVCDSQAPPLNASIDERKSSGYNKVKPTGRSKPRNKIHN